ncbi:hypothetical protein [Nocardia brasiliensis]|uniref:hypothetical protein n=1 Tax=Nocardia brasiliensis TaxID=37326 RepID=UPI003D93E588
MGSVGEELRSPVIVTAAPQQIYCGTLYQLQQHRTPEQVSAFFADGPPPPQKTDGATGLILHYEAHTPTVDQVAALLAEMETAGWITSTERKTLAELPAVEITAELKARMVEQDTGDQHALAEVG